MISKNGPCPCKSGKQYKRCCGIEDNPRKKGKNKPEDFFRQRNTPDIIKAIAGITLLQANHGKNIRLENITIEALKKFNESKKKISDDELKQYLHKNYPYDPMEDPPVNLFTEVAAFHGGDYLIFPGITESPGFILNNLLPAIFNWPNAELPHQIKSNCSHAIHIMLLISNLVANRLGYSRYMYGRKEGQYILVPEKAHLSNLKKAVWISKEEMEYLLSSHAIARQALTPFIAVQGDLETDEEQMEESPLLKKPIIAIDDGYIVASPASISYALIDFIREQADVFGCADQLHDAYHGMVWNSIKMQLRTMGFKNITIEGIEPVGHDYIQTLITKFDDDKIAVIQYIALSQSGKTPSVQELAKQREDIFTKIAAIPEYASYQFLDIALPSPMGNDLMFATMGNSKSHTLSIPVYDFDILCKSKESNALDLWKFALAREKQLPRIAQMASLSFLDEYKIYKDHSDSFYLTDEAGFDMSQWMVYGHSQSFIEKAKLLNDEHSVAINVDGRIAKTMVVRKDKYSPIYFSPMDLLASDLQFAVEGYGNAVWVKPLMVENPGSELRHLYWELTDLISYWLWQICDDIKDKLSALNLPCISFTYELNEIAKFETLDDRFIRNPDVYNKLNVSSAADTIQLVIPDEIMPYFYGGENEGDRIIVRQLLLGINDLLAKNNVDILSAEQIEAIINKNAPLGLKKKFIILHSRSNLLLDKRNLKSFRYIQDYDVSVVLDSIGSLLAAARPPVGEITETDQKTRLVRNIVLNALLPHLKKVIDQYNNEELIKRLIGLNESLIQHREDLKIKTPTRIACFVSQEEHTEDLQDMLTDITRTTIAARCLLEHIAAEPATGTRIVSKAGIDELIAIMDQIISWGSLGDQLTFDLFDIRMGVLPSGRIGTQKTVSREIFDPYYNSKTRETVQDAINSFEQEFPKEMKEGGKEVPANLDKAFLEEFKISFTGIARFIDILAGIAFEQSAAYAVMGKKELLVLINKFDSSFTEAEYNHALHFLGLTNRGDVKNIPKGYEGFDISPWRFNRRLSLMRKPLIICETADPNNPLIYWGPRQLLTSRINLAEQCMTDRLKVSDKSPVKKAMSKLSNERGARLVKSIVEGLKIPDTVLDSEVPIAIKGKLKHTRDIGDIDVLLIDIQRKILYSLECKSFAPSRNIKEMIEECEKLIGSKSDKGLIKKHEERDEWVKGNLKQVGSLYGHDLTGFKVVSAFVTREDMLFPYLKKVGITMPFITQYDLETKGYECLIDLTIS